MRWRMNCEHKNISWYSGSSDWIVVLNGDCVGECLDCGMVAYV